MDEVASFRKVQQKYMKLIGRNEERATSYPL